MVYSQDRQTVGATRARQGRTGRNILWVLVIGIALVVLGFAATWAWKARDLAGPGGQQTATQPAAAAAFQAPRPDAATRQNYQKGGPLAPKNGGNPPS
jgi:heme/copper-type cytochrome/quinol oxidase subunit 2